MRTTPAHRENSIFTRNDLSIACTPLRPDIINSCPGFLPQTIGRACRNTSIPVVRAANPSIDFGRCL